MASAQAPYLSPLCGKSIWRRSWGQPPRFHLKQEDFHRANEAKKMLTDGKNSIMTEANDIFLGRIPGTNLGDRGLKKSALRGPTKSSRTSEFAAR